MFHVIYIVKMGAVGKTKRQPEEYNKILLAICNRARSTYRRICEKTYQLKRLKVE